MELPRDLDSAEATSLRREVRVALSAGRSVFAERWHLEDAIPTLTLWSCVSFTKPALTVAPTEGLQGDVLVTVPGRESLVTLQLFETLVRRGLMAGCPCGVGTL